MLFNSFPFIGLFALLLVLIGCEMRLKLGVKVRNITLLAFSYAFYGYFNWGFLLILAFVTISCFVCGNKIISKSKHSKAWLIGCTVLSLLPLVFYKYAFFLLSSTSELLNLEVNLELVDGLLLPVGISFFTFQALTYPLDICRGKITHRASLIDFALFVSFFPTILSGPIEKARNLLPQFRRFGKLSINGVAQGGCIFIWGVFKKMVIADRLANYVDWAYGSAEYVGGVTLAVAAVFYSIQIYCDFSGYSDMALGVAKALGFDITKNFRQPYFSRTIKEFWRKWHIALTSWFTEYVYFSLGGSHVRLKIRWIFNISMVFILSGLWHGAAWNFLMWGCLHAVYYLAEYFIGIQKPTVKWNRLTSLLGGVLVFILVTFAWIFFRVEGFHDTLNIINKILTFSGPGFSMGASHFTFLATIGMLVMFLTYELAVRKGKLSYEATSYQVNLPANIFASIPLLLAIAMFGMSSNSFVYFQF